ncbi:MAG: 30S ribosomal protein S6 [Cyanobacteria bacterium P01_D01_bin.73]
MSRLYETMYILRPDLGEEKLDGTISKYRDFLKEKEVDDLEIQHRGKRRLAYEIKRCREGVYIQMNYTHTNGSHIAPMEKLMRIDETILRYMTIKLDPREVAAAAAAEAKAAEEE